jgi:hypothetical protein
MTDLSHATESPPIDFELTEADMRTLTTMSAQRSYRVDQPTVAPSTRRWASLVVVACLGILVLLLLGGTSWGLPNWSFLMPLLVGAGAASKLTDNQAARRNAAKVWIEQVMQSSLTATRLGRYSVRVTSQGVEHSGPLESRQIRWPGIHSFTVYNGFVFVSLGWEVLSIPGRACEIVGGAQAFADFGNRRLAEMGVGVSRTIVDYLATHSVKCRQCGYNLRGATKLVCPECARPIGSEDVPEAWKRE